MFLAHPTAPLWWDLPLPFPCHIRCPQDEADRDLSMVIPHTQLERKVIKVICPLERGEKRKEIK